MTAEDLANRRQAEQWNTTSGPIWAEMQAVLDRMLAPFEARLTEGAFPGEGRAVLDIGCGAGATTLAMARRLGRQGRCLGVDISAPLVDAARARAAAEGLAGAAFVVADAQTHAFEPGAFDAVISRFGVMFFDDPQAAFANIRRAARPDGRLTFIAWRSPAENPFMTAAAMAVAPIVGPSQPPAPGAPGQFAFADGGRVGGILAASGWRDVDVRPLDEACVVAEADLMAYALKLGPAGLALRDADEATREAAAGLLTQALAPYVAEGRARFTAACWLVTARA